MNSEKIYSDIAKRTGGDIYIGVVGPVRTGKSTFIQKFMETLVIPNIDNEYVKERAVDELPQSAGGKTIMTTEPKFIPEDAVELTLDDGAKFSVRMIDCVGYVIPSSVGYFEDEAPRMVNTPWFDKEVPFNMAAEIGTQKVISEHSTIGLVVTTDGSITDLPRDEYEESEQRVIKELTEINKPFVVLLNCLEPRSEASQRLCEELKEKYNTTVMAVNCLDLDESDIMEIISQILYEFPIREININMPKWINTLEKTHWLKENIFTSIKEATKNLEHIREVKGCTDYISTNENIANCFIEEMDLGKGTVVMNITLISSLFFKIIGEATHLDINDESDLLPQILKLIKIKDAYAKFENALNEVEATGYGIVMPSTEELSLDEPEIIKQGGQYGIRLKATAPSIHMMKANITTEINPIVGSEKQSEELVLYMLNDFEESPEKIWESNIFGKSLNELVNEGLHNKLHKLPPEARQKLSEAVERIINEGCSGLICFII